ncbi:hypothetical protein B0H10DRAFT_597239 [Mycena sp. CBHHK59/15]|nr:hypothetical protein B0H10DRAFT_597239 [Mycena sp. CBHHK59/15]
MPASYAARNVSVYVLCGQISAIMHFTFAIGILVLLPDQSSPPSTLTGEELATGVWIQALVFRIVQTVLLVFWIICIMSAFVQLFTSVNREALSVTTITTLSDAATFTALPSRTYHPRSKSRSSSFSSPRPRRDPLPRPECTRRSTPPGADDFQNLHDPFASPSTRGSKVDAENARAHNDGTRPTRMSAWGTLPPRPPPNVLVINPPAARRLPTLRGKQSDCSMSLFSYTTPSAYSQDTDAEEQEFDLEEALLAQKLLRRLDSAEVTSGRWIGSKLGRSGRELRTRG